MPGYDPAEPCVPLSAVGWPADGPPLVDPAWRTAPVLALARGIGDAGAWDRLPVLADALEDAGCDNQFVLNHCRVCPAHLPTCWVISAVLEDPGPPPAAAPGSGRAADRWPAPVRDLTPGPAWTRRADRVAVSVAQASVVLACVAAAVIAARAVFWPVRWGPPPAIDRFGPDGTVGGIPPR